MCKEPILNQPACLLVPRPPCTIALPVPDPACLSTRPLSSPCPPDCLPSTRPPLAWLPERSPNKSLYLLPCLRLHVSSIWVLVSCTVTLTVCSLCAVSIGCCSTCVVCFYFFIFMFCLCCAVNMCHVSFDVIPEELPISRRSTKGRKMPSKSGKEWKLLNWELTCVGTVMNCKNFSWILARCLLWHTLLV